MFSQRYVGKQMTITAFSSAQSIPKVLKAPLLRSSKGSIKIFRLANKVLPHRSSRLVRKPLDSLPSVDNFNQPQVECSFSPKKK